MSLVDEKITLNKIQMDSNEDPTKIFDWIKAVETKFNTKIKQDELITVVLIQSPKECQAALTSEQWMKKGLDSDATLKDLKEVTKEHCKLLNCDKDEKEVAACATDNGNNKDDKRNNLRKHKKFTETCNNCGQDYRKERD